MNLVLSQEAEAILQTYRLLVQWVAGEEKWSMEQQYAAEEVMGRVEDYFRRQGRYKDE